MGLINELKWRGLIQDITPGVEEKLGKNKLTGYIGFDPTSDSLHIGSLVQIMLLVHLQRNGHIPVALIGGATGMVGDPSGKSEERNLLSEDILRHNESAIKKQLEKFIDFSGKSGARLVNNYDWYKDFYFLNFIRDVGKHISINYMMSKESVKKRLETGISFTEFTYQLVQGYDFYWLYKHKNCTLQLGGSDQWGNITTGIELIRRKDQGEAYGITCPLVTKSDGTKFGKTEEGNVWLDPEKTSPYRFYQFWLNVSDKDASKYVRIFTLLEEKEILSLEEEHKQNPHQRILQKTLAKDVTVRVHSEEDYNAAVTASSILFGKSTKENLKALPEKDLLDVFSGVPQFNVTYSALENGLIIGDFLTMTGAFPSKGEVRRTIKGGGLSINKEKITDQEHKVDTTDLLNKKYILVQKGKKSYYLVIAT